MNEGIDKNTGDVLLRLEEICKYFPGVTACDHISIDVRKGEILTLLGENGAGKTTLMNCIYGLYRPDHGRILWKGKEVDIKSAKDAINYGIGMVHQHFMLVPPLTVAENVVLGLSSGKGPLLDLKTVEIKINDLSDSYGFSVDPKTPIWQLPVGIQQRVEIIKALYREVDLLILDEPTAVLTPGEVVDLFKILKELTKHGLSIIFISHKLAEVIDVSDRVTVLRNGRVEDTVQTKETDICSLTRLMVGRDVVLEFEKPPVMFDETVIEAESLETFNDKDLPAIKGVSFEIRRGEILGIAGVDGNGQKELAECMTGLRPCIGGTIKLCGQDITNVPPRELHELNIGHIPEDRQKTGLILDFSIADNLVLKEFYTKPFSTYGFLNDKQVKRNALETISKYRILTTGPQLRSGALSGGNQQKVILGRELARDLTFLVAAQPTRGLDIGATEFVRKMMLEQCRKGTAILLISSELDEIMSMSHRIAVLYKGEIMGIVEEGDADIERIGLMMTGVRDTHCAELQGQ